MKILGSYVNGNYTVTIYDDGTKIKETEADEFIADFPESMDVKITNACDRMCKYCHEASTPDGKHGNLDVSFIDTLRPWTEMAIGGGNPLSHPDLIPFLTKLRDKNIIANMTVNEKHFMENLPLLRKLRDEDLIKGLGISYSGTMKIEPSDKNHPFILAVKEFPNAVIHIINGLMSLKTLGPIAFKNFKVLILGYKDFRRGKDYHNEEIDKGMHFMWCCIEKMIKKGWFRIVSFDNLAIKQLQPERFLSTEQWNEFYQGDDGTHTMYVDLVEGNFAVSSTRTTRMELLNTIDEMFEIVKENSNVV